MKNVLVEGNIITRCQTEKAAYNPIYSPESAAKGWATNTPRGRAAIRLHGNAPDRLVTDNIIRNNTIDKVFQDAISYEGNVCRTTDSGNLIKNLGPGGVPVRNKRTPGLACPV